MDEKRLARIEAKHAPNLREEPGGLWCYACWLPSPCDTLELLAEVRRLNVLVDTMSGAVLDLANLLEDE